MTSLASSIVTGRKRGDCSSLGEGGKKPPETGEEEVNLLFVEGSEEGMEAFYFLKRGTWSRQGRREEVELSGCHLEKENREKKNWTVQERRGGGARKSSDQRRRHHLEWKVKLPEVKREKKKEIRGGEGGEVVFPPRAARKKGNLLLAMLGKKESPRRVEKVGNKAYLDESTQFEKGESLPGLLRRESQGWMGGAFRALQPGVEETS